MGGGGGRTFEGGVLAANICVISLSANRVTILVTLYMHGLCAMTKYETGDVLLAQACSTMMKHLSSTKCW